jgi:hypothetical protein
MPIYEKPVWKLMYDMVEDLGIRRGEVLSKEQALAWFGEHYPKIKQSTVSAHLIRLSINAPGRIHHRPKPEVDDLFFKVDAHHFRLYDPESDPAPIYGAPERPGRPGRAAGAEPSLANEVLAIVERHEGNWRERLEASEERVRALEQENEGLREELERGGSAADEIVDEVMKERVSMLDSAPLDTVIREAGVVLEDRLRVAGGADSALHGTGLVDAVLGPGTGTLIFSSHRGEQEGVRMLYRGAMQFIRNPPMHKLIEYPESTARLFIGLIDSLLQLLSELEPRRRGEATVRDVRRMLTRIRIPDGQRALYEVLYGAGDQGLSRSDLAAALNRSKSELAGVLGALGHRINRTEGLEGKGGIEAVLEACTLEDGDWHYRMRPVLREALEAEGIV